MVKGNLNNAVVSTLHSEAYSDGTTNTDFYGGGLQDTDGTNGFENSWTVEFPKWHKYYLEVDIFAAIIDTVALWTVGKGFKASEETKKKLDKLRGWGVDDFNSIMENLLRTCLICGDSFAEIIRDKAGRITNLKPLNSGTIKVVVNEFGIIKRYEQISNGKVHAFKTKDIFHLCWNRLSDEIHGKSMAEREEATIKQIKQLIEDLGLRFHRIVKPVRLFEADTDDPTTLSTTEANLKKGYENCEFIVIPKGTLEAKDVATIPNAQDAIEYLNLLMRKLVISCGVPEIVLGWSLGSTDATAKVVYLAFQQPTERKQKFLEEQLRLQLGIELDFEFPASLEPALTTAGGNITNRKPINRPPADDNKKNKKINTMTS